MISNLRNLTRQPTDERFVLMNTERLVSPLNAAACLFLVLLLCTSIALPQSDEEGLVDDHVVILLYHHVATGTPASTSVTPGMFAAHLRFLRDENYTVLSLDEVLWRLTKGKRFPTNSVAITFDDAYVSVIEEAWPLLREHDYPFTVFVSTDYIDRDYSAYMDWTQLRTLADSGAQIANHGVVHGSALALPRGGSADDRLERFLLDAKQAEERIRAEVGVAPRVYAWPYGEFNDEVEQGLADLGWYGLGQQSGAAGQYSSLTAVPRFPMSTAHAGMTAFAERVNSEPLPVKLRNPPPRLRENDAPPSLQLFMDDPRFNIEQLSCFNNGGERLSVQRLGQHSVEVRSAAPLPAGRSKYTCTAPHSSKKGVYGWYSHLWIRGAEGSN
ncbi:MAG: polysaccharide deacetylase family protein [Woeseia sp.]